MATTPSVQANAQVAYNEEAEASVLGAVILDGDTVASAVRLLRSDCFYLSTHRVMFQAMERMFESNRHIDAITLAEELKREGTLESSGGAAYMAELAQRVPSTIHIDHYAGIVRENAVMRSLTQTASQIIEDARSWKGTPRELLDRAEQKIFEIAQERSSSEAEHINTILHATMAQIEAIAEGKVNGIKTGFAEIDEMTTGLQPSQLVIVAARPSMGKTTFGINIAEHIAVQQGKGVVFFSLETAKTQIVQNILCSHARINAHAMRGGYLGAPDWTRLSNSAGELAKAPIYIDDTPGLTAMELKSKTRALRAKQNIEVVIIDYMQLMEGSNHESRQQEITSISRSLKALARELDVVVIALAQLSRAVESREGNKPRMSDLRESGSIEQDADVIMMLFREEYYDKEKNPGQATVVLAKQRNGPTGDVTLTFQKEYLRFHNYQPELEPQG